MERLIHLLEARITNPKLNLFIIGTQKALTSKPDVGDWQSRVRAFENFIESEKKTSKDQDYLEGLPTVLEAMKGIEGALKGFKAKSYKDWEKVEGIGEMLGYLDWLTQYLYSPLYSQQ
jgi:hypothetical protein